jgi:hypothetical protein
VFLQICVTDGGYVRLLCCRLTALLTALQTMAAGKASSSLNVQFLFVLASLYSQVAAAAAAAAVTAKALQATNRKAAGRPTTHT